MTTAARGEKEPRILRMQDPGAHSATAPRPSVVACATVHGAKAKRADARARRLRARNQLDRRAARTSASGNMKSAPSA